MKISQVKYRVFFDAYELAPGAGKSLGIYNYAKNLWRSLKDRRDASIEFIIACNPACVTDFDSDQSRHQIRLIGNRAPSTLARQVWLRWGASATFRKERADIYFSPKGFLPHGIKLFSPKSRSVVVVHDLIPFWYAEKYPGYFGFIEEAVVNRGLAYSVANSDGVIAISDATAADIAQRLGRRNGVEVVHNGVPISIAGPAPLPTPYLFAVASRLPHKNASGVLAAYRAYRKQCANPLPLLVCGIPDPNEPGVVARQGLSDSEMHGCYANARLVVFLSQIEGFGFPPVEAMAHGTPVLCSDIPSLREVTRGAANYVPPNDAEVAGKMLSKLLELPPPDRAVISSAVAGFSWEACAEGVINALQKFSSIETQK